MLKNNHFTRRKFLKTSSLLAGSMMAGASGAFASAPRKPPAGNKLPKWKGFNLLDFFSPDPARAREGTKEEYFKWMADWGFDFVRIPMAYPSYVKFDRSQPIPARRVRKIDRRATDRIEQLVYQAHKYGLHVSLNLHRARYLSFRKTASASRCGNLKAASASWIQDGQM